MSAPSPTLRDHPKCKRRRSASYSRNGSSIGLGWLVLGLLAAHSASVSADASFSSGPYFRWGQASTISGTTLLVHGGKVDVSNAYSYTSAPTTNDLYSLDLSQPFNVSSPNWVYESGSENPDTSQGPAVAFHSFNVFTSKRALVFGGDGGPNLPISTNADSAWELDLTTKRWLSWTQEPAGWAQQPMRRIYHSGAVSGKDVWITGGEKADGSGIAFAETWIFDPSGSSGTFSSFSAAGTSLPLDLIGHGSVVLSSSTLLIIGGYSPSQNTMVSMSTIWALSTGIEGAVWTTINVTGLVPSPRRNFALALLDNNRILIHGGGDATLQSLYSDGFILNAGASPMTWTAAAGLEQLGPRSDHMAAGVGSSVLFGFGHGGNGPAGSGLSMYDSNSGTWGTSYTPGSTSGTTSPTGGATTTTAGQPTVGPSSTSTITSITPTPTTATTGAIPSSSSTGTTSVHDGDHVASHSSNAAAIALGTVFGVGALVLAFLLVVWLCYRRSRRLPAWYPGHHHEVLPSGETDDPMLPGAQDREKIPIVGQRLSDPPRVGWLLGLLPAPLQRTRSQAVAASQRFDMLGDEDARSFGHFAGGTSAGTTMSAPLRPAFRRFGSSTRQLFSGMINASTTSFKTAFGIGGVAETPGAEPDSPDWWDKEVKDPLAADAAEIANLPSVTAVGMAAAARQRGGAPSHSHYPSASSGSGLSAYRDPFSDSLGHSRTSTAASRGELLRQDSYHPFMLPLDDPPPMSEFASLSESSTRSPPPPTIETAILRRGPIPQLGIITPGTLASSETSLNPSTANYPLTPTSETAHSSSERPKSPNSAFNSLLGGAPATPMKRSDSWWGRFGKTSLTSLTRSASGAASLNPIRVLSMRNRSPTDYTTLDFRDPNPAPRLAGIEETGKSNDPSPESAKAKKASGGSEGPGDRFRGLHSKSMTSMKTADSEALERMGRKMDVVRRDRTTSSEVSLLPTDDELELGMIPGPRLVAHHIGTGSTSSFTPERPTPPQHSSSATSGGSQPRRTPSVIVESPAQLTPQSGTQETYHTAFTNLSRPNRQQTSPPESFRTAPSIQHSIPPPPPVPPLPPLTPTRKRRTSNGIASRVAAYEQMASPTSPGFSGEATGSRPPEEHKRRKSVGTGVRYGLTERPSLFVANPDRRSGTGSTNDSTSPPA